MTDYDEQGKPYRWWERGALDGMTLYSKFVTLPESIRIGTNPFDEYVNPHARLISLAVDKSEAVALIKILRELADDLETIAVY